MNRMTTTLLIILLLSCEQPQKSPMPDIRGNILLFNGLSETFSLLNINSETMHNNIKATDEWPNHMVEDNGIILTNSGSNTLWIIDIDTLGVRNKIYLGKNKNPWMAFPIAGTDYIYVSCYLSHEVLKLDRRSGDILTIIEVGNNPQGGAIIGNRLFIGNTKSNSISVINIDTDRVISTINLTTSNPQTIIPFPQEDEIHIVCSGVNNFTNNDGTVIVFDSNTLKYKGMVEIGGSPVYATGCLNREENLVYLYGTTGIYAYNYKTLKTVETGIDNTFFSGLVYIPETDKIYASNFDGDSVMIFKGDDYSFEKSVQASDGPQQLLYIRE